MSYVPLVVSAKGVMKFAWQTDWIYKLISSYTGAQLK